MISFRNLWNTRKNVPSVSISKPLEVDEKTRLGLVFQPTSFSVFRNPDKTLLLLFHINIYSCIFENTINENLRNFTATSPNNVFYDPDQPKNPKRLREERKEARAREKRLATVFNTYYIVEFRGFERQKTRPSTNTNAYLGRYRFQKSR